MERSVITWPAKSPRSELTTDLEVAVLIPCYNEELTIGKVILDFRQQLPQATIYVFDNNSTDHTADIARELGAVVVREPRQGKGYVVQSMFRLIDADVYLMIDGDDTYPVAEVHRLLAPLLRREADMVVGSRLHPQSQSRFKQLNRLGNRFFLATLNTIFGVRLGDILSGYRAFTRSFVKTVPLVGGGFEVESELTIKALEAQLRIVEVPIDLGRRPEGSFSKIHVVRDGLRILFTILALFRDYKPLTFFGGLGLLAAAAGLLPGTLVVSEFLRTGLVPRLPSAVLAVGLELAAGLSCAVGVILHCMTRRIHEVECLLRNSQPHDQALSAALRRRAG